jgi:hypothetical protein
MTNQGLQTVLWSIYIVNFQHVIETKFTDIMGRSKEDDDSIYQSQYDDEDSNY